MCGVTRPSTARAKSWPCRSRYRNRPPKPLSLFISRFRPAGIRYQTGIWTCIWRTTSLLLHWHCQSSYHKQDLTRKYGQNRTIWNCIHSFAFCFSTVVTVLGRFGYGQNRTFLKLLYIWKLLFDRHGIIHIIQHGYPVTYVMNHS